MSLLFFRLSTQYTHHTRTHTHTHTHTHTTHAQSSHLSISLATCSVCVQYYINNQTLQCSSAHSVCSYVQPYDNTPLDTAETQLQALFTRVEEEVKNGSLTEDCSEVFTLLYCHQVYVPCQAAESQGQVPLNTSLCKNECVGVRTDCEPFWALLTDLVDTVAPGLPPLLSNCTTDGGDDMCIPLLPSKYNRCQWCQRSETKHKHGVGYW